MTTATQSRLSAAQMIADVLADGSRIDRYLRRDDDGAYYTTSDRTYLSDSGPITPAYVAIPTDDGSATDDELFDWGFALLAELDAV